MTPLLLAVLSFSAAPPAPVPTPADVRRAVGRSLPYLAASSADWRTGRKCVSCHQVPFALWPLHEARARGIAVDGKALDSLTEWSLTFCMTDMNKGVPTGGFLSTMAKLTLGLEAAPKTDQLKKAYDTFVPLMVKYQRPDGSWKEGNFIGVKNAEREGIEVDTMWTVLGLNAIEKQAGASLDKAAREQLGSARKKALVWLKDAKPATRTDWLALRLLVEREKADHWRAAVLRRQNANGGWPFVSGGPSHPIVTGEVLFALAEDGKVGGATVRQAWSYLLATQRTDGSWRTVSRAALGNGRADKVNDINVHWGTGWATIGLLRTLPR